MREDSGKGSPVALRLDDESLIDMLSRLRIRTKLLVLMERQRGFALDSRCQCNCRRAKE